jgi:hypothetical protein
MPEKRYWLHHLWGTRAGGIYDPWSRDLLRTFEANSSYFRSLFAEGLRPHLGQLLVIEDKVKLEHF